MLHSPPRHPQDLEPPMANGQRTKKLTMPTPYWGDLPGPTKASALSNTPGSLDDYASRASRAPQPQSMDTATAVAPQPRPIRDSVPTINTGSRTESTMSPYTSPTTTSPQGRGWPSPLPYSQSPYSPDVLEKRRLRASKNREEDYAYFAAGLSPPPSAPDRPKAPPVDFRHPYGNGGLPYTHQKEAPQQPDVPLSPGVMDPDYYQRLGADQPRPSDTTASPSSSRRVTSDSAAAPIRNGSSSGSVNGNRKASLPTEGDNRLFADARSPLQRLELTLDSITKEEKRARIAAAEQRARERTSRGGTDLAQQHAVRFNDKVTETETDTEPSRPQVLPDPVPAQPGIEPQHGSVAQEIAQKRTSQPMASSTPKTAVSKFATDTGISKRNLSFRERAARNEIKLLNGSELDDSHITPPATTPTGGYAVTRTGSNNLTKENPGDPWYQRRAEAENKHAQISTGQQRGSSQPPIEAPGSAAAPGSAGPTLPSKTAGGSVRSRVPPSDIAVDARRPPGRHGTHADNLESPSNGGLGVSVSSQRKEVTAGEIPKSNSIRSAPGPRQNVAETGTVSKGAMARPAAAASTAAVSAGRQQQDVHGSSKDDVSDNEHQFREHFYRHEYKPGQGMYNPPKYLDEWRKGTIGTLSGTMLDLSDETTPNMGTSPSQRQANISSRPRRAEAFDGEYDETNGMYDSGDSTESAVIGIEGQCQSCVVHRHGVVPHARKILGPSSEGT